MAGTPAKGFGLLWILRTVSRKSRRIGFHHLGGLEKMLPVFLIIAIFTMVWTVGRGIADEKNGRGTRLCRATHHRAWAKAKHLFDGTWGIWLFGFSPEGGTRIAGVRKPPDLEAHPKTLRSPEGDT